MVSLVDNDILGMIIPPIEDRFGSEKTEKLKAECLKVDSIKNLKGNFKKMVDYGISMVDWNTGTIKGTGAKRFDETLK